MKFAIIFLFLISCDVSSKQKTETKKAAKVVTKQPSESDIVFFKKIFKNLDKFKHYEIEDPISEKPVNTTIWKVLDLKENHIGYIRDIVTSTGCGGPCLPVVFTLFYNEKKEFIELLSKKKLTKKNHVPFSIKDYIKLKEVINLNPSSFAEIGHPTEMVDAISGATKLEYKDIVVSKGAYTTLRVNTYNQHTLKMLKSL